MSQHKQRLIRWSPHHDDEFLVAGSDIRLFKMKQKQVANHDDTIVEPFMEPPTKSVVTLMRSYNDTSNFRCLSWCRDKNKSHLLAVGLSTPGKVLLVDMSSDSDGTPGGNATLVKEFLPRHSRNVMAVRWNPVYHNQIAIGQDKARQDECVLVYDVTHVPIPSYSQTEDIPATHSVAVGANTSTFNITPTVETAREETPIAAVSNGEGVVAMSWLPGQPFCVAAGTSFKWLRIYDLRGDRNAPQSVVAHPRGVYGVVYDTLKQHRVATFSDDGNIKVWDMRKLAEPTKVIHTGSRALTEIAWCPTRAGTLASITKSENCVCFWDIERPVITDKGGDTIYTSNRSHYSHEPLVSFSWHPRAINRLITLSQSGLVASTDLHECIPLTWSPKGEISFNVGQTLARVDTYVHLDTPDQSEIMYKRALAGYSLDITKNMHIFHQELKKKHQDSDHQTGSVEVDDDPYSVRFLWEWLNQLGLRSPAVRTAGFHGVLELLGLHDGGENKTASTAIPPTATGPPFTAHQSPARDSVQAVCGWGPNDCTESVTALSDAGEIERATALALWHLNIPLGISVLTDGMHKSDQESGGGESSLGTDNPDFGLIAMVLAGFKVDESWRKLCDRMRWQFKHAYLRGAFAFLSTVNNDFAPILQDSDILLHDRVAFACRYLQDTDLVPYVENLASSYNEHGDLAGVVLTGFTQRLPRLMSNYLDRTADVQTAALVSSFTVGKDLPDAASQWIATYRELLNHWEMWHARASFDVALSELTRRVAAPPQISVRCNFCSHSVTPSAKPTAPRGRYRGTAGSTAQSQAPPGSCPGCKKPLPRCCVCLLPLGCTESPKEHSHRRQYWSNTGAEFDRWFTWCQTCRHGGHATHLTAWFQSHSECPVTGCLCQCLQRDNALPSS